MDILCTSDFGFWTPGFEQTYVVLQTLDIIQTVFVQTSDIKFQILSDFVHQTSRLWTLDISFQTSDCGLRTYFRRRIVALIVRHCTDAKLRTQRLRQFICHTTKTNIHICNQIS